MGLPAGSGYRGKGRAAFAAMHGRGAVLYCMTVGFPAPPHRARYTDWYTGQLVYPARLICTDQARGLLMVAFALSTVFLAAAAGKLASPWAIRLTLRELLPQLPRLVTDAVAGLTAAIELVTGSALVALPGRLSLPAAAATALLACSFSGAYVIARLRP